jgi:hypothetical protein
MSLSLIGQQLIFPLPSGRWVVRENILGFFFAVTIDEKHLKVLHVCV